MAPREGVGRWAKFPSEFLCDLARRLPWTIRVSPTPCSKRLRGDPAPWRLRGRGPWGTAPCQPGSRFLSKHDFDAADLLSARGFRIYSRCFYLFKYRTLACFILRKLLQDAIGESQIPRCQKPKEVGKGLAIFRGFHWPNLLPETLGETT